MNKPLRILSAILLTASLAACGGGGGGGATGANNPPPVVNPPPVGDETGTVAVLLTDAAGHDYDQALATITAIELIGDEARTIIWEGLETIDLLSLEDFYEFFAVAEDVPAYTEYSKVRLKVVEDLLLRKLNDDGSVKEEVAAELPGKGKLDLNNQGPFQVAPGATLIIEIDWQMNKAFKIIETGNGRVKARPVIMVNIHSGEAEDRLARIFGVIDEIDDEDQDFRLCRTDYIGDDYDDDDDEGELEGVLELDNGTWSIDGVVLIFDDKTEYEPASLRDAIADESAEGTFVEAEGRYEGDALRVREIEIEDYDDDDDHDDDDYDDDDRYRHCVRVRTDDRTGYFNEDGLPITFADLMDGDEATVVGMLRVNRDDDDDRKFTLDAIVVERGPEGTFPSWKGMARSAVNADDQFDFGLDSGQGFVEDTVVTTQLYESTPIVTREGEYLNRTVIQDGTDMTVDGVLSLSNEEPDLLRAALLIVDFDDEAEDLLRGVVADVDPNAGILYLTVDGVERCVDADEADIFVVETDEDQFLSVRVELGDLIPGQRADVFGQERFESCFDAETIIADAVADDRPDADAGEDQVVATGETVFLDGSGSSDPNDDALTFGWTLIEKPEGSTASLTDADTATPSFVADLAGEYEVMLVVSDGTLSDDDTVEITANGG